MSDSPQVRVATLGFPRIGPKRALKSALERYWTGQIDAAALQAEAADLRAHAWRRQKALGADILPSGDFSLYDHVLDMAVMVGAVPEAYRDLPPLDAYFAMARGAGADTGCGHADHGGHGGAGLPALELTKWFDTNYHYLTPEFEPDQVFRLNSLKPVDEFVEAKAMGHHTRPVLLGPVTFLKLGKSRGPALDPLALLGRLLPVFAELLQKLEAAGADWVQIDEPCLALDLTDADRAALAEAYGVLAAAAPGLKIMLATYFGGLADNLSAAAGLPVDGLHLDLARAPEQLDYVAGLVRPEVVLSLGVIDGRNVWRADLPTLLDRLEPFVAALGAERVILAPSCSLLHVPLDLKVEDELNSEVKSWLAFAVQKVEELAVLAQALNGGRQSVADPLGAAGRACADRRRSLRVHSPSVQARLLSDSSFVQRAETFEARRPLQAERLGLPVLATTTIGSFPQTAEVRQARAAYAKGALP